MNQQEQYFKKGDGAERLKELSKNLASYKCRKCNQQPAGNLFLLIKRDNEKQVFCEGCEPQGNDKNILLLSQRKQKETIWYTNNADHECQDNKPYGLDRFCYTCYQFACHQCQHNGHQIQIFNDLVNTQYVEPLIFIQGSQKAEKVLNDKLDALGGGKQMIGEAFAYDQKHKPLELQDFALCDEKDKKYQQDEYQANQKLIADLIQGLNIERKKLEDATKLFDEYCEQSKQNNLFDMMTRGTSIGYYFILIVDQYNQRSVISKLDGVIADVNKKMEKQLEIVESVFTIDETKLGILTQELIDKPQYVTIYDEVI